MTNVVLPIETIVSNPDMRGGRPSIAGTSVTVSDVAAAVYYKGAALDDLADQLNLTLADVHAALAYYHAHRDDIEAQIRAERDQAEALRDMQTRRAWIDSLKPQIAAFCQRWKIVEFALFGSVLRDDFRVDSDIDVLVTFAPDAHWGWKIFSAEDELKGIFGRDVDLVEREAVEENRNPRRRVSILESAQVLYAA